MIAKLLMGGIAATLFAAPALADTVTSLDGTGYVTNAGTSWGKIGSDNGAGSSAAITNTNAHDGNGSLELKGDLTRVQTGYQYALFTTNIASLNSVTGLTFDWQVAADSTNQTYTPALRLLIQNGSTRTQLIWEGANNGVANNAAGQWYSTTTSDLFYQNVGSNNPVYQPGTQTYVLKTVADWIATGGFGSNAYVSAISVGAGSGAGATYHAFVDDVKLTTTSGTRVYNFETAAVGGAVPETATWGMMILGMGAIGVALRRRASVATRMSFAG